MDNHNNYDVIIIGGGPGGVSTALYAARGGLNVIVVHDGNSALNRAERIQNYYGTGDVSGSDLYQSGLAQAQAVGVTVVSSQVTFIRYDGESFSVSTPTAEYTAKRAVIATGAPRKSVNIEGVKELEGKGVSYCAVCDGFFYRKRNVAVIGSGEYAEHEYNALKNLAATTYLLTDGQTPSFTADNTITKKLKRIVESDGRVSAVEFDDGSEISVDGVFIAVGTLGSVGIAKSVGVMSDKNGAIVTDEHGMTNVSDLYAVGDCTAGIRQIGKAVADGIIVGMELVKTRNS